MGGLHEAQNECTQEGEGVQGLGLGSSDSKRMGTKAENNKEVTGMIGGEEAKPQCPGSQVKKKTFLGGGSDRLCETLPREVGENWELPVDLAVWSPAVTLTLSGVMERKD